jgi:hypothetical protein
MFAAAGLLTLVLVDVLRPQEYFEFLQALPLLHLATGLTLFGFVLDLRLGLSRLRPAPHLVLVLLFAAWCLVTVVVRERDLFLARASALAIPIAIYVLVAHGIQTFRMLQVLCAVLLSIGLALSLLGIHQGLASYECHRAGVRSGYVALFRDGRPCAGRADRATCEGEGAEPGYDYVCERAGLVGTQTDHGRVRYRGTLQDPNELALAIAVTLPFAFAFLDRRRSATRLVLALAATAVIGLCVYFTRSRGGQLVFLSVLAVYFVHRYGLLRGLVVGLVLALPILLFGGRTGAEGDASTMERLECWWVGLHLLFASPVFGVGYGQFTDHHYLTAHNSLVLVAAELGIPGLLLWTSTVYVAIKIPLQALRAGLAPVARTWSLAILASMVGLVVGGFFLSFSYKDLFWLLVGLTGVLYAAIQRHDPSFRVGFRLRDLAVVGLVDTGVVVALVAYTGARFGW